jgi:integrase
MRFEAANRQVKKRQRSQWPKSDLRYWTDVVYRPAHQRPDGTAQKSEYYVVRIGAGGRRTTFPLGTSRRTEAAAKARDIHSFVAVHGVAAAIAKFKKVLEDSNPLTVGQYLGEAQKFLEVRPKSFTAYAAVLRRIAASIAGVKLDNTKFDYQSGGREVLRQRVDAIKLELLTPENIRKWQSRFLARAGGDPVRLKAARNNLASSVRVAKALFCPKILKQIKGIEHSPFSDIEVKQPVMRYRSEIDFEKLLVAASTDLAQADSEAFKAFLLCACAGLRRSEADSLEWDSVRFDHNLVRVKTTRFFEGKSEGSVDDVYLDPEITALFRGFWAQRKTDFVIESALTPRSETKTRYQFYRCRPTFARLVLWLRAHGVDTRNPIHTLRKEFGSQLTKTHGIFIASRVLRHSSVQTTERFYASQKGRATLGLGHLLARPENVIDIVPNQASG